MNNSKTYRATRHDVVRKKQRENSPEVHHPNIKQEQIERVLSGRSGLLTLELFAGEGNLTDTYLRFGDVECYDKRLKTGDSYLVYHRLISERKTYDVIDLDPYGFPNRFFPDIFLLIENGFMFITMPKPYVNVLNGITQQHLTCYYGESNPSLDTICSKIHNFGLCHWRDVSVVDVVDMGRLWRLATRVKRVKATEYCGVRNQPLKEGESKD